MTRADPGEARPTFRRQFIDQGMNKNTQGSRDPISLETAERMLSYVRGVEDRDTWVKLAFVLKDEFGEVAFDAWDQWSQSAGNYDARAARDVWKSCRSSGSSRKASIGTLVSLAKEGGWKPSETDRKPIDPAEVERRRVAREQRLQEEQAEDERLAAEAAAKAAKMWAAAHPAEERSHNYLARKQLSGIGARTLRDMLLVPLRHGPGALVGLQVIHADGTKKYLTGTPKLGAYTTLGKPDRNGTLVICEGYATGVSIHMATGFCTVVAFDSGNLEHVAKKIRAALPTASIVIAADDDAFTEGNPGMAAAIDAATQVNALVAVPLWAVDRGNGTDFNDLHVAEGLDAVRMCFEDPKPPSDLAPVDEPEHEPDSVPDYEPIGESVETQWSAPLNLFAETPVPALRPGMLPEVIEAYAFDQAALLGVSPAMIAIPALVACAAVIHDGLEIQPKRHETGWRESARLWCAIVGAPSVRKSPSLKRAISRLKKINKDLCEDNEKKLGAYQQQLEAWKEEKKAAKRNEEPVPQPPEQPTLERLIVEDVTIEALSEILKHNSRGVLCVQDELTGWFGSMDAYNGGKGANKDRAHWLEIYNGGHRMVDRVMRGNVSIPNWSACMVGGIQPDMIKRVAANMGEDGLMQRFMVIMGENSGGEQDRPEDAEVKRAYGQLIDHLHSIVPSGEVVTLSEPAHIVRERITEFANELITFGSLPGGLKSHLGKWAGLFARLLLTFHTIECASRSVYPTTQQVSGATAERVETLMRKFLLPHALSYYTDILGSASDLEHVRWIAGYILAKEVQVLKNRDLVSAYRQWRGMDQWRRQRVLKALEDYGWIAPHVETFSQQRQHSEFFVNPEVHQTFKNMAEDERKRRLKAREHISDAFRG
jgi:hypothetical protein